MIRSHMAIPGRGADQANPKILEIRNEIQKNQALLCWPACRNWWTETGLKAISLMMGHPVTKAKRLAAVTARWSPATLRATDRFYSSISKRYGNGATGSCGVIRPRHLNRRV